MLRSIDEINDSDAEVSPSFDGTWIVRITDGGEGDIGAVAAATLSLCLSAVPIEIFADGFESPVF